ncbi:MAG TPA: protein kinase [Gemmatimonadaceae bacterium]
MSACAVCSTDNPADGRFCAACGAVLASTVAPVTGSARVPRPSAAFYDEQRRMSVPLRQSFRFIHEPVSARSSAQFVGRQVEIASLADRILFSEGGSFLVTGYRGVGKTSFVNQVIRKLEDEAPRASTVLGDTMVVDVSLNVARPMQPSEMMHHIIRCMNDRLIECGIYQHLDDDLRDALKLAYDRTSVNMARKVAEASERSFGVNEASIGGDLLKAAMKLSWTAKKSRSTNFETSYLGYDDKAAEHDVISLSRRLAAGYVKPSSRVERLMHTLLRRNVPRTRLKIIFVFDELDKLEEFSAKADADDAMQKPAIDDIIGSLKNLFTTSGVSFIFVAGKDLQERWLEDVGRGDSVYESVFAYDKYLPCLWADVGAICDAFVDRDNGLSPYTAQIFDAFKKYLAYRGRGIPRRIIRTFNEYVEWDANQPSLRFASHDVRRVRFFAGLQNVVDTHEGALFGETLEEFSGTQSDKRRLGVYYLIDWILGRGTSDFTLKDVLEASRRLSVKIALAEEIAPRVAEDILAVLVDADYIQLTQKNLTQVFIQPATGDVQKRYRVSPRRLVEMGGDRDGAEADALVGLSAKDVFDERDRMPKAVANFRIVREIGRGGMGVVYEGIDERHGQRVAVKVLNESLTVEGDLARRFEREAMILKSLEHQNIVRLVAWGREALRLYIAMEFLDGVTVEEVIRRRGHLSLDVVLAIAEPVARAVQYVHEKGYVRNDIKPTNIMITSTGRVCLLDFGISRPHGADDDDAARLDTRSFVIIGTPQFMAPEQFETGVDERSDVYSLGVVLYRMLTGSYPFEGKTLPDLIRAHAEGAAAAPSSRVPVPEGIDDIVLRCLAKDPGERYQTTGEIAQALRAFGEGCSSNQLAAIVKEVRETSKQIDAIDDMRTIADGPDAAIEVFRRSSGAVMSRVTPPPMQMTPLPPAAVKSSWSFDSVFNNGDKTPVPAAATFTPPLPALVAAPQYSPPVANPGVSTVAPGTRAAVLALVAGSRANIVTTRGSDDTVRLTKKTTFGRNSENDVVLRGATVSRYHAVFDTDGESWLVEDANSGAGTFVNGEPLIDRRVLNDGDEVRIGEFVFLFAR